MFKIHTKDGQTTRVDLSDSKQACEWVKRFKDLNFQKMITGITIIRQCGGRPKCPICNHNVQLECSNCGHHDKESSCKTGVQFSLSKPLGFEPIFYLPEHVPPDPDIKHHGGERITCFAGDVKMALMAHAKQPAAKLLLSKTGKQRYNPYTE